MIIFSHIVVDSLIEKCGCSITFVNPFTGMHPKHVHMKEVHGEMLMFYLDEFVEGGSWEYC